MEKNKFNPINYLFNKEVLEYDAFLKIILERIEFKLERTEKLLKIEKEKE